MTSTRHSSSIRPSVAALESLLAISSTVSHASTASLDVLPNFSEASRASSRAVRNAGESLAGFETGAATLTALISVASSAILSTFAFCASNNAASAAIFSAVVLSNFAPFEAAELSLESISSTVSQAIRASGDVAPYFSDASRAAFTASELSTRDERAVVVPHTLFGEGTNALAEAERRVTKARENFIVAGGWVRANVKYVVRIF
mmetsp:Transcript_1164/g.1903  ORF Transcript_1164/g.1903 Transcript_1164/m.1903 type:complete len:205 (+) Transcript_1164:167-781(+)